MIPVTDKVTLDERDIELQFVRASGPGGQNVNKVATAVQLRFTVDGVSGLPEDVRTRLRRLAGRRLAAHGTVVIDARRYRTQERNREDAVERLVELVRRATQKPKARKPTRPSAGARQRRLDEKKRRGSIKRLRRQKPDER